MASPKKYVEKKMDWFETHPGRMPALTGCAINNRAPIKEDAIMPLTLQNGSLYGNNVKSHKVAAFTLSERVYPSHYKTPQHAHQTALFCSVLDGEYTETYGKKIRTCKPSTMLFHAP